MNGFDLQPQLKGSLIELRPLAEGDFDSLFAVASDPLVWEQHPEPTRYQRDVFLKFFDAAVKSKGALVACDLSSGEVLGSSRFSNFEPDQSQIEVGYTFLSRRCWGQGHNREMKHLMLNHAFQTVDRVVFYIGENNLRSRTAIAKIGARLIKRLEQSPAEGGPYTVYAIDRADFISSSLREP